MIVFSYGSFNEKQIEPDVALALTIIISRWTSECTQSHTLI